MDASVELISENVERHCSALMYCYKGWDMHIDCVSRGNYDLRNRVGVRFYL